MPGQKWRDLKAHEGGSPSTRPRQSTGREESAISVLPVLQSKAQAVQLYDRISGFYDVFAGAFETRCAMRALDRLSLQEGENVLEIGFGTGRCLPRVAEAVGPSGRAIGIDIRRNDCDGSEEVGAGRATRRRGDLPGDAAMLPYRDAAFDACFMSFTLELFDTPEIPEVLRETSRVLRPGGRIGVSSMSRERPHTPPLRLYEWGHRRWPAILDCRPIYVGQALREAGGQSR